MIMIKKAKQFFFSAAIRPKRAWRPDFWLSGTGVASAPAAESRLHLGTKIRLRRNQAFSASDSFPQTKSQGERGRIANESPRWGLEW
ncbi:MAG: hypothetical protein HYT13_01550 [Candidatus Liptonbacteria bacterium]|nr:hypothetical protein [Candidatus Liptonbacteria bacterium]